MTKRQIKRALISLSDKTGILNVAKMLRDYNVELVASDGTQKYLSDNGIIARKVSSITGNIETFRGRVKTIDYKLISGIVVNHEQCIKEIEKEGIEVFDLVICNLYPFAEVALKTSEKIEAIENIDIGGVTLLRSAAKNFEYITLVSDPFDYGLLINELTANKGQTTKVFRKKLAKKAFELTTNYDKSIGENLFDNDKVLKKLRYGENPSQSAHIEIDQKKLNSLAMSPPIQGKELSYNNLLDANSAISTLLDLQTIFKDRCISIIVKHLNPCGVAVARNIKLSLEYALKSDPISAFGGIVAINKEIGEIEAHDLLENFFEIIIAKKFTKEALDIFKNKKNLRLIEFNFNKQNRDCEIRSIDGGILYQDRQLYSFDQFENKNSEKFNVDEKEHANFGMSVVKNLKSNAICLSQYENDVYWICGAGIGNPNRILSVNEAFKKAHENNISNFDGVFLSSDGFFPFPDVINICDIHNIKTVIQPGGSIKDLDVINAATKSGIRMYFSKERYFAH